MESGEELGTIIDEISGGSGVKTREGAIGILTKNKIGRLRVTIDSVTAALIPFVNREFYLHGKAGEYAASSLVGNRQKGLTNSPRI